MRYSRVTFFGFSGVLVLTLQPLGTLQRRSGVKLLPAERGKKGQSLRLPEPSLLWLHVTLSSWKETYGASAW
jgi:hypothetical protein